MQFKVSDQSSLRCYYNDLLTFRAMLCCLCSLGKTKTNNRPLQYVSFVYKNLYSWTLVVQACHTNALCWPVTRKQRLHSISAAPRPAFVDLSTIWEYVQIHKNTIRIAFRAKYCSTVFPPVDLLCLLENPTRCRTRGVREQIIRINSLKCSVSGCSTTRITALTPCYYVRTEDYSQLLVTTPTS